MTGLDWLFPEDEVAGLSYKGLQQPNLLPRYQSLIAQITFKNSAAWQAWRELPEPDGNRRFAFYPFPQDNDPTLILASLDTRLRRVLSKHGDQRMDMNQYRSWLLMKVLEQTAFDARRPDHSTPHRYAMPEDLEKIASDLVFYNRNRTRKPDSGVDSHKTLKDFGAYLSALRSLDAAVQKTISTDPRTPSPQRPRQSQAHDDMSAGCKNAGHVRQPRP